MKENKKTYLLLFLRISLVQFLTTSKLLLKTGWSLVRQEYNVCQSEPQIISLKPEDLDRQLLDLFPFPMVTIGKWFSAIQDDTTKR